MNILIKQAIIVDPNSRFNGQTADIFLENGFIKEIGTNLSINADQVISSAQLYVSPGWVDIFSNFADPGYEFKETLETGAAAAAAGGYTDVFIIPNTDPVVHSKSQVEYVLQRSRNLPVTIHPIGAVTKNTEGKELAEMYDMRASGAVCFSDGTKSIQSSGLLVKALQYIRPFDGTIIQLPDDKSINARGLMNEGIVSTQLGLEGKPAIAEELIVARDIMLTKYAESKIHFTGISTQHSLEHILENKKDLPGLSCSVTPYHLFFTEEDMRTYDSNLKVNPPLRSVQDREALRRALVNGEIDCIASHHLPHEQDSKMLEFEYASNGMIGLETAYAAVNTAVPALSTERWVEMVAINPRKLFGLKPVIIEKGELVAITIFDPSVKWKVGQNDIKSRSKNSPFYGKELTGRVTGIINKEKMVLNK